MAFSVFSLWLVLLKLFTVFDVLVFCGKMLHKTLGNHLKRKIFRPFFLFSRHRTNKKQERKKSGNEENHDSSTIRAKECERKAKAAERASLSSPFSSSARNNSCANKRDTTWRLFSTCSFSLSLRWQTTFVAEKEEHKRDEMTRRF